MLRDIRPCEFARTAYVERVKKTTPKKKRKTAMNTTPSRTDQFGARHRGQTFKYLPEDVTIVGSQQFAEWVGDTFGKHGPKVLTDPAHPAQALYDPRVEKVFEAEWLADLTALADDVRENGVEQPIGFTLGETRGGHPQVIIVYGRRRVIAAAFANQALRSQGVKTEDLVHIEGKAKRGTWEELRLMMLAENDNRKDNPPSVQAENVYRAQRRGTDLRVVANRMGKPVAYLERLLALRECAPEVIKGVDAGRIPLSSIDQIRKLPPERQAKAAAALTEGKAKSGQAATAQIRQENPDHAEPPRAPGPPTTPPKPARRRPVLEAEKRALEEKLTDPKYDGSRRVNQAALEAIRWALGEIDEPPSAWKSGPTARAS